MHLSPLSRLSLGLLALLISAPARADSLESRLNALLASPQLKSASVSLDIVEVTPKGPVNLFAHDATTPLGPASNCKILTTAAAFERYGPNASFKTILYQVGPDLVLVGGGDPAFGDAKLAAESSLTPTSAFERWADQLRQRGLTQFRDLIVDDRIFDNEWVNPNWPPKDALDWFSAPIGGLNFNANCLDWIPRPSGKSAVSIELIPNTSYISIVNKATRGAATRVSLLRPPESNKFVLSGTVAGNPPAGTPPYCVPIYDPGLWTGTILHDILTRSGVASSGQVRRATPDEQFKQGLLLASHETPILNVIRRANTNSLNMMAEGLCKRLGYDAQKGRQPGSWENGTAAVEAYVTSLGAKPEWLTLDDGSGLSKKNRVAAKAFTTVLAHIAARPDADQFIATLAIPREDGTLERRFKGLTVAEHVHAKTGHIAGVSTLSGYIDVPAPANGDRETVRRFAFSILCNKYQGNVNPWQDQVCQAIYQWAGGR